MKKKAYVTKFFTVVFFKLFLSQSNFGETVLSQVIIFVFLVFTYL